MWNGSPSPIDAGFAPDLGERLDQLVETRAVSNVHSVIVVRHGRVAAERYYSGPDECWGTPLGDVVFTRDTLHDLRSISKTIVGIVYGIALAQQQVPDPTTPIIDALPRLRDLAHLPSRSAITIEHALTMTLGLEWNEDLPYSDPDNSEIQMERATDRARFVLEQPLAQPPGTTWRYSGGATALLGAILTEHCGRSVLEILQESLLQPLGIAHAEWTTRGDGSEAIASGLRLRAIDLAKIGYLALSNSRNDHAGLSDLLIPAAWLEQSFKPRAHVDDTMSYGYHWWVARAWNWVAGFGNGGQRMTLLPRANAVLVVTAGNYNTPDAWKAPVTVLTDAVLPALR